ncbi:invertase, partial [Bacteroides uniformis]
KENLIHELLKAKVSKRKISKLCKVDRNTLDRFIKQFLTE